MARFKAPKNFGGITHGGESFKASKGFVTADIPVDIALAHGLVPESAEPAPEEPEQPDSPAGGEDKGA